MIWSMHSKTLPITLAPELESETNKWDFRRVSFSCTNIVGWCVHIVCKYPWLCAWREHRLHLWKASLEQFDTPSRASQREIDWKQKFGLAAKKNEILFIFLKHFWPRQHLRRLKHQTKAPEHFEWGHPRLSLPQDKHWHDRQSAAISASNYERNQQKKMNMKFTCRYNKCTLEIAFNQLSHSFEENLAMRCFEVENNSCAVLSVRRDSERSWWNNN